MRRTIFRMKIRTLKYCNIKVRREREREGVKGNERERETKERGKEE